MASGEYDYTPFSIALDAAGQPHVSYACSPGQHLAGDNLKYAYFDGAAWRDLSPDVHREFWMQAAMVLDTAGHPHIVYTDIGALGYVYYDGTSWQYEAVDDIEGGEPSLVLDTLGRLHVVCDNTKEGGWGIGYARRDGAEWRGEKLAGLCTWYPALAVDAESRLHIAYQESALLWSADAELQYASYNGSAWQVVMIDQVALISDIREGGSGGMQASGASLALDAEGRPHVAYYDAAARTVNYASLVDDDWQIERASRSVEIGGHNVALTLDALGRPRMAYIDREFLRYTYYDGTAWRTRTVAVLEQVYGNIALTLGPEGQPHILYGDQNSRGLRHAYLRSN